MKPQLVEAIRKKIKREKVSQNEYARRRGFTPQHFSGLLTGRERIGGKTAMKLQAATGIDAREFLECEGSL